MSSSGPPDFEIAALRRKTEDSWDPMAPGPGIPWEDRAAHGLVGGFVKTCLASMTGPRKLATDVRRANTTNDARAFVIGCGLMWGVSAAYHVGWALYHKAHHPELLGPKVELDEVNNLWVGIDVGVALVGGAIGIVLLWVLFTAIYNRLVQQEARSTKVTEPVVANIAAYAFGPSILALIPVVGPALALVVMFLVMVAMGTTQRLRLATAAAVINALLSFLAVLAVGVAASSILHVLSDRVIPSGVPTVDKASNLANQPAIR